MMTMPTNDSLLAKWNSQPPCNAYIRVDAVHPLDFYIGYEDIDEKSLLLVTDREPTALPSSRSILAIAGQRGDGKWALMWRLIRREQESVFVRLCYDLVESSRTQCNDGRGLEFVSNRYRQWHKLMEHQGSGLLSEAARKGLLGEILYLLRLLSDGMRPIDVVSGWLGPEGADRDFVLKDGWHEVKAQGADARTISISSLEQLDAPPPGEIVAILIDSTSPDDPSNFSLRSKIDEAKTVLQTDSRALELFSSKLLECGYIDLRDYDEQYYRSSGCRRYRFDWQFPRLTKRNVPSAVSTAKYEVDLSSIEAWRTE